MSERNKQVKFYATEDEQLIIKRAAKACDQTASDYMRKTLLRAAKAKLSREK